MDGDLYITTSIPYVNAKPHIGHALELIQADTIARYVRLCGGKVTFQTGTDENAHKNVTAAEQIGVPVRVLVDRNAEQFRGLVSTLGCSPDSFIRTTEARHRRAVQRLWAELKPADVYQKSYRGLCCEGCEDFLSRRDLIDGQCPEHRRTPAEVEETNYFFRLSGYQDRIEELIDSDRIRVRPPERKREVLSFVCNRPANPT